MDALGKELSIEFHKHHHHSSTFACHQALISAPWQVPWLSGNFGALALCPLASSSLTICWTNL
ncbi:hypothetical protein COLO4_19001 [Corchorus olitorius]|uniref:Uncharacterized protein n=1 Tax=Corchorus olitorius TaxID=93759 RepID=A0A1R3J750_9ROSI|nr:hypothetical protein COLO4_19001 [Corchorus olitorius]